MCIKLWQSCWCGFAAVYVITGLIIIIINFLIYQWQRTFIYFAIQHKIYLRMNIQKPVHVAPISDS